MRRLLFLFLVASVVRVHGQMPAGGSKDMAKAMKDLKARVYGKLIDGQTGKPVEYATILVMWYNKDSLVGGAISGENGDFAVENLPPVGGFRFKATRVGYKSFETRIYTQIPNKLDQDLGDLSMKVDEALLKEVDVVTEKSAMNLSIDKRTYNVEKDLSVKGGTAVDVMKNVPGLTVDADGNVQLRSQSPMIFVDGRPTNLTLQQIPADQIDRVEVITNPSVKYDASATGGILNIILKKNLKPGYNGMAMAYAGTGDRYGGMLNFNLKEGRLNVSSMFSYNQAINNVQGYTRRTQLDSTQQPLGFFSQDNMNLARNQFNFGRLGVDYALNNRNTISVNGVIVAGRFKFSDRQNFNVSDKDQVEQLSGLRINDQHAGFEAYNAQLMYKRTYPVQGKELTADVSYNYNSSRNGYQFSTYAPLYADEYQKNGGTSYAGQMVMQTDFVNPLSETRKFEAGMRVFYKNSIAANTTSDASGSEETYTVNTVMSNRYVIDDMINAAYVNYSDKTIWDIGYQAGLRFEHSYYKGNITDKQQSFSYQYPTGADNLLNALFPGIYLSKKFGVSRELQLNFSRKIQRPNFFQLMPVVMFADRLNYRIGNPQLKPEFRNIGEINYNRIYTKGSFLVSGYFRYEEQPITDIAYPSLLDPTVLVNTAINGKNNFRYGTEATFKYTVLKNFDATLNANIFYIYMKGLIVPTEPEVKAEGYAFNAKATLSYKFPKQLTLQVNGNYESPRILLLGATLPIYSADVSLNKMIGTKWILNATLSDAFNTRRMGAHYETPYYIQDLSRRRETRYVRFSVTYMFGKMDASIFKRRAPRGVNENQGSQDGLDFGR
jgi:hypothetical protein